LEAHKQSSQSKKALPDKKCIEVRNSEGRYMRESILALDISLSSNSRCTAPGSGRRGGLEGGVWKQRSIQPRKSCPTELESSISYLDQTRFACAEVAVEQGGKGTRGSREKVRDLERMRTFTVEVSNAKIRQLAPLMQTNHSSDPRACSRTQLQ